MGQPAAVLVVEVHHAEPRALRCEQLRLGLEVVLHVGVELHVLRAQVVEDGDVEDAAVDPAEHQRVAGDLHGDRLDPTLAHHREQGLEVGGFGGGALGLDALVADAHLDRTDQAGAVSGPAQPALDEVRGGGLPGGSGDAQLEQVAAGAPVDLGGQLAHGAARVLGDQDRQAGRGGAVGARRVGEDGGSAQARGLGGEVGAVEAGPGQGRVEVAGADRAGVVGDAGDLSRPRALGAQPVGQFAQGCRAGPVRPGRSRLVRGGVLRGGSVLISVWHGGERTGRTRRVAKRGGGAWWLRSWFPGPGVMVVTDGSGFSRCRRRRRADGAAGRRSAGSAGS